MLWYVIMYLLWYGYTIPLLYSWNNEKWRIARLYGPDVHTGLPLALGKHPRGVGLNPPFAVLYVLPVSTQHPYRKPCPCLSVPNSFSTSESMGTCFTEGGSVWHAREFGWSKAFYHLVYKYFRQYCMEYSSIWVPPGGTWVLIEYLSTWVLSLSLDTKLQLWKEHCRLQKLLKCQK